VDEEAAEPYLITVLRLISLEITSKTLGLGLHGGGFKLGGTVY
jgi:hypothetical protein